jgi:hypothetical protein
LFVVFLRVLGLQLLHVVGDVVPYE